MDRHTLCWDAAVILFEKLLDTSQTKNVAKQKTLCYTTIAASYREDTIWPSCDVVY